MSGIAAFSLDYTTLKLSAYALLTLLGASLLLFDCVGEMVAGAEQPLRAFRQPPAPYLRYLSEEETLPLAACDVRAMAQLVEEHGWLVDRPIARLTVRWPEGVEESWVRNHATVVLERAGANIEDLEDMPLEGFRATGERLRTLLGGTQWYREAMLTRSRPLCEAWRGVVLAGREPTDQMLSARFKLSYSELSERFVELGMVFAVEPAALLPGDMELREGIATAVGGLDSEQQLVVSLYFEQQLTLPEIAEVMGLLPLRVQELFGRAAVVIAGEAVLSVWPAMV